MESKQEGRKLKWKDLIILSRKGVRGGVCACVWVIQGIMISVGGWKSPPECVVSSPWKQIMSQGTSNAAHNEISYPAEYHIYEPAPFTAKEETRWIFVSEK